MQSQTLSSRIPVAELSAQSRSDFIWRTYGHVAAAILLFAGIETYLFDSGLAVPMAQSMLGFNWLLILGAFMIVGWLATHVAHTVQSKPLQYVALVGFVVAQAIIFLPLLAIAMSLQPGIVESAVGVTLLGTGGLTAVAFITRKDFSFLRGMLVWGGILALIGIAASVLFRYVANFLYDGDAPLAERRAQALAIDQSQLRELLGEPEALEQTELDLELLDERLKAKSIDSIHDLLLRLGDLSLEEIAARVTLRRADAEESPDAQTSNPEMLRSAQHDVATRLRWR